MITLFLITGNINVFATELVDQIKDQSKNIFKTLTRKSLKKAEVIEFLSEYIIIIDDKRGDGLVTYYFEDAFYKRYKDLELISEDRWSFSILGHLKMFNNNNKEIWKIQPEKINTINIKKKLNPVGELHEFSYQDKTDFYIELEELRLSLIK